MCSVITTVRIPAHIDVTILRQKLREQFIIIYEGKGCYKNNVFQVGNIGELSFADIQFFLESLKNVLLSFERVEVKEDHRHHDPCRCLGPVSSYDTIHLFLDDLAESFDAWIVGHLCLAGDIHFAGRHGTRDFGISFDIDLPTRCVDRPEHSGFALDLDLVL